MPELAEMPASGMEIDLSGTEKAAVLLLSLNDEIAAEVLQALDDREMQIVTGCVGRLPSIGEAVMDLVRREFLQKLTEGTALGTRQSRDRMKSILGKFLSGDQIDEFYETVMYSEDLSEGFESVKYVDAQTLATFISTEHPQTIALLLAHLDVQKAAQVLPLLSKDIQADIVLRLANLRRVSPQVVKNIQEVFVHEVMASGVSKTRAVGGAETVAELLNNMDSQTVQDIFKEIEEDDAEICEEIRSLMFVFTDLINVDDREFQSIIKEITNEIITLALKTAPDDLKEKIFRNVSSRAAELIQEELEVMGPVKLSEVEKAQKEIVMIARRLEDEGKINLGGAGGAETLV